MTPIRIAASALLLAAGGCNRGDAPDERDRAAGRILPASVSDAMLQTDQLQVEAPLVDPSAVASGAGDSGEAGDAEPAAPASRNTRRPASAAASAADATVEPSPRPAATPQAQPTPE